MSEFWNRFQGRTVGEQYLLGEVLSAKDESAVYLTEPIEQLAAVIKLRSAEGPDQQRRSGDWLTASRLTNPNLIRVFATGTAELDGHAVDYIVMERADETLAGVLAERALSESETRDMLRSALAALDALHHNNLIHGRICPSNVMAVGDTLKLSSDNVLRVGTVALHRSPSPYDAPEVQHSAVTAACDSWSLGALVVNSLTLQLPDVQGSEVALPALDQPLLDVAKHTLLIDPQQRWSVGQIAHAINGRTGAGPLPGSEFIAPHKSAVEPRVLASRPDNPPNVPERGDTRISWRLPAMMAAAALLLGLLWFARKPNQPTAAKVSAPAAQSAAALPVISTPTVAPATVVAKPAPARAHAGASGAWYVVVATYTGRKDAEKRARAITARWPKFRAHVFDPPVRDPHHLVVIGANLSQDEADSLRKRARAAGLPSDVYIKKFAR